MHARVTTIEMEPARIDDAVKQLEENDMPTFEGIDGYRGFTLFADRSSGKVIGVSYWDSEARMQASEEAVKDARQRAADTGGAAGEPQVERYEVAVDSFVR
jgi:heme-degrading monooxygenase HmoA